MREAEPEPKSTVDAALQPLLNNSLADFLVSKDPANSRYGVLLLKELCDPTDDLNVVSIGTAYIGGIVWVWCIVGIRWVQCIKDIWVWCIFGIA